MMILAEHHDKQKHDVITWGRDLSAVILLHLPERILSPPAVCLRQFVLF